MSKRDELYRKMMKYPKEALAHYLSAMPAVAGGFPHLEELANAVSLEKWDVELNNTLDRMENLSVEIGKIKGKNHEAMHRRGTLITKFNKLEKRVGSLSKKLEAAAKLEKMERV